MNLWVHHGVHSQRYDGNSVKLVELDAPFVKFWWVSKPLELLFFPSNRFIFFRGAEQGGWAAPSGPWPCRLGALVFAWPVKSLDALNLICSWVEIRKAYGRIGHGLAFGVFGGPEMHPKPEQREPIQQGGSAVLWLKLSIVAFETKCDATAVNIPLQVKFESIFVDKMSSKFRHTPHSNHVFFSFLD